MAASPVQEWTKKAEDNYASALDLARRRRHPVPDVVCSQCHQSAEKYLKALLVRHQIEFPKTHDLRELEDLLSNADPDVRLIDEYLHELNPYGVDVCYPGVETTTTEAKTAVKAMKEVRRFVRTKLGPIG